MNAKHSRYAEAVLSGHEPPQAYRIAYRKPQASETAAAAAAYRLSKMPEIAKAIEEGRRQIITLATAKAAEVVSDTKAARVLSFNRKREILRKIAEGQRVKVYDKKGKPAGWRVPEDIDRIRAIQLDNLMIGDGWQPPESPTTPAGESRPVSNTVQRVTIFRTKRTTAQPQTFETENLEQ